ncbi:TerB family tellurite resistance protein [Terricaulis sp.]|uniref:TerB family tellurite resistance protein n=1 Tax=Terricaulis sp. TaxID=2768686 RepID=UPI003783B956
MRLFVLAALIATPAYATPAGEGPSPGSAPLAILVLIVAVGGWLAVRAFISNLRANKTKAAVGDSFAGYALEVLVNAAKIDGRVNDTEQQAIAAAMSDIGGAAVELPAVQAAFAKAKLSKAELVAYLQMKAGAFSRDQKVQLLKALMSVFVADGRFDETEHAALVDYTAAVGFDRGKAPDLLKSVFRGSIT